MEYSGLYELIKALEYGTNLHIGVIFFGYPRNKQLILPFEATIHTGMVCQKMKTSFEMQQKCVQCRQLAIQKAKRSGAPFCGCCINGIWEYTHPIFYEGILVAILFIGNILEEHKGKPRLLHRMEAFGWGTQAAELLQTLEHNFTWDKCSRVGAVLESYIHMLLNTQSDSREVPGKNSLVIRDLVNYIENNLFGEIQLQTISELFHYNEQYLGRWFKKELGCSIKIYICRRRIENAKKLLCETGDSVISIAARTGFENVTYFNRRFRQFTGKTPTEFREACREDARGGYR